MIPVVIMIVILAFAGLPIARMIDPSLSKGAAGAIGFMVGCGLLTLSMISLSALGIGWSFFLIVMMLGAVAIGCERYRRRAASPASPAIERSLVAMAFDVVTALSLCGYGLFATVARPWEWDFWAIWGLKGRTFFLARGIATDFLTNPDVYYSHPDYPPLLSVVYSFSALLRGHWDDRWLGLLFVAFAAALVLVIRDEVRKATGSETYSAFATLALSGAMCSPWVGLGDGALVAFGTTGLLLLARGVRDDKREPVILAGVVLGIAAMTKNEGIALAGAAAVALLVFDRRRLSSFVVPVSLLGTPWLVWRATMHLETDVVSGGLFERVAERLSDPVGFLTILAGGTIDRGVFWLVLAILLVAGGKEIVRRQGVMLVAVLIQLFAYAGVYAGTVHDLASHVQSSMGRISSHVALVVGVICVLAIWDLFLRGALVSAEAGAQKVDGEENVDVDQGSDRSGSQP